MRAGIIGAGKVGFSLGKYLVEHGIPVTGYYSRNPASAKEASEFTETVFFENLADIVKDSDTLFITVPDGVIGDVWDDMGDLTVKGKNICHCSGSVSSAVFLMPKKGEPVGIQSIPFMRSVTDIRPGRTLEKLISP